MVIRSRKQQGLAVDRKDLEEKVPDLKAVNLHLAAVGVLHMV